MKNKGYEKALYLYNKGNIERAIEICEKEMSKDLTNSNVINLKGVLLYLKGELEDSIALWNINRDYNNDNISSSYLKDAQRDFKRRELYEEAEELIYNLNIDEAIDILELCEESDFNSINVNNALATCYFKKGDYEKVKECLEKVFKLDKYNDKAKDINKELESVFKYNDKREIINKAVLMLALSISIILIIFIGKKTLSNYELNNKDLSLALNNIEENKENEIIINKDIENSNEKNEIISQSNLSNNEIRENYIKATEYYDEGKYEETKELLERTITYLSGGHLDDDIIFLLGSVCDELGDIDKAIENFDRYITEYSDGSYIQEAYYKAALLYKNKDIVISKSYANKILINYPNSIYNNSYVEEIMNS